MAVRGMVMGGRWKPLFSGAAAQPYERAIDAIATATEAQRPSAADWGPALLHAYLSVARSSSMHVARSDAFLDDAVATIESRTFGPSLYSGLAGVGWLVAHVDSLFNRRDDEAFADIDTALRAFAASGSTRGYDLVSGAVGVGVYFLERLPHTSAVEGLVQIAHLLQRTAEIAGARTTWHTPAALLPSWQRHIAPNGYYNLGVAHGVPGIVGLLAAMKQAQVLSSGVDELLAGAAQWLVDQRSPDGLYAPWIAAGVSPPRSRVSWCYGELGLSLTLLQAARALNAPGLEREAISIAEASAARTDVEGTVDAGLCHGAAGNGHLFNRLFQATGRPALRDAAVYWFNRALEMRIEGAGVGGYRAWRAPDVSDEPLADPWEDTSAFLVGATGIALAFLAATSDVEPNWDIVLLARLPPCASPTASLSGEPAAAIPHDLA